MTDPREHMGRVVREAWIEWAREQPNPKPSWLIPWEHLDAGQREVDMRIGEAVVREYAQAEADYVELQRRIEDLRSFEREYRARLRAYHQHHIDLLDGKDVPGG